MVSPTNPNNTPNSSPFYMKGITLEEYLSLLDTKPELDVLEPVEYETCFVCHQVAIEVFASLKNKKNHKVFCSSDCFNKYRILKKRKERVIHIRDRDERKDVVKKVTAPVNIPPTKKAKEIKARSL